MTKDELTKELQILFLYHEKMHEVLESLRGRTPNIPDYKITKWQSEIFISVNIVRHEALKYLPEECPTND